MTFHGTDRLLLYVYELTLYFVLVSCINVNNELLVMVLTLTTVYNIQVVMQMRTYEILKQLHLDTIIGIVIHMEIKHMK